MPEVRTLGAIVCAFFFVFMMFVLKHVVDVVPLIFRVGPFVLLLGMTASWLLIRGRRKEERFSHALINSFVESAPLIFSLGCVLPFTRLFMVLDKPEEIGPAVMNQFLNLFYIALFLGAVAIPLKFRFDTQGAVSRTKAREKIIESGPKISLWRYSFGVGVFFALVVLMMVLKHASDLIMAIAVSPPTLVLFIGSILGCILVGTEKGTLRLALQIIFRKESLNSANRSTVLDLVNALRYGILIGGVFGLILGCMKVFLSLHDPGKIGPGLMVAMVAPAYSVSLYFLLILPLDLRMGTSNISSEELS